METIKRKHNGKEYLFVGTEGSRQMVVDGFKGPFYGRFIHGGFFADNVLYGEYGFMLNELHEACVPLVTVEQYEKFYNDLNK